MKEGRKEGRKEGTYSCSIPPIHDVAALQSLVSPKVMPPPKDQPLAEQYALTSPPLLPFCGEEDAEGGAGRLDSTFGLIGTPSQSVYGEGMIKLVGAMNPA
jgi:hypothetical protein